MKKYDAIFEAANVGTILKDRFDRKLVVVEKDSECAWLRFINEDGELGRSAMEAEPRDFCLMEIIVPRMYFKGERGY